MKGQQELLYVVPFVAKVLESSLRSVVIMQFSLPILLSGVMCGPVLQIPGHNNLNLCTVL